MELSTLAPLESLLAESLKSLSTLTGMYPGIEQNHYFLQARMRIENAAEELAKVMSPVTVAANVDTSEDEDARAFSTGAGKGEKHG